MTHSILEQYFISMRKLLLFFIILMVHGTSTGQGYLMMAGGGSESNSSNSWSQAAYGWFVEKAGGAPIIVLSQSDTSTWIPNYFLSLGASEVHNMRITADSPQDIATRLQTAGGVFLKGGNQQNYIDAWRGTIVEDAIMQVFLNGGVIGGTSAGAMVGGEFISPSGPISSDNLRDPFNGSNVIVDDFLGFLPSTIFDSHYFERGRAGRLLGMMGRIVTDHSPDVLYGIGIDDQTAVLIEPNGTLTVSGSGAVHVFRKTPDTFVLAQPNQELEIRNMEFHQLTHGFSIHLETGELFASPGDAVIVESATLQAPTAGLHFRKSNWTGSYLQQVNQQDGSDIHWVVLNGGGQATNSFTNIRDEVTIIDYDASLIDDSAYLTSLFGSGRLFVNLSVVNWLQLMGSDAFRNGFSSYTGNIELLLEHANVMGDGYVTNASANQNISYQGRFVTRPGGGYLPSTIMVDSTYTSQTFFENRASAPGWLMHVYRSHIGITSSGLTRMSIIDGELSFPQQQIPSVVYDARAGYVTARSPFSPSSQVSTNRNSAAVSHGMVHVIPTNGSIEIYTMGDTSIENEHTDMPQSSFSLTGNFPNPFNPTTTVEILSQYSQAIDITVYDVMGRRILSQNGVQLQPGANHHVINLSRQNSGMYFVRVRGEQQVQTMKIMLVK